MDNTNDTPTNTREWGDGLARQVLVEAIYGTLITALPGAFTAELFGDPASPRARIAKALEDYIKEFGTRPAPGVLDELIAREIASRPEAEQEAIADEWGMIQSTDPDENPEFVTGEVREWIEFQRVRQALLDAATALPYERREAGALDRARKILTEAMEPIAGARAGTLAPIDAADLVLEPLKPVPWILRPLFTADTLGLLTSYPGEGKTTLTYHMVRDIARGEPFLGMPSTKTKVLILGVEESRRAILARLRRVGVNQFDRGRIFVHPTTLKASPQTYRDVIAFMKAQDIGLLVIDTMSQFWTVESENDNAEVAQAMRELLAIAHDDERCVLVLHHDGKGEGVRKSRGASSLPGIVDLHLALSRVKGAEKDDPRRVLSIEKKREDETPWSSMVLTFDGSAWAFARDTEPEPTPGDQVVQALMRYRFMPDANPEGMSSSEIGVAIGLRGTATDDAIRAAIESGRVESNGRGSRARRYRYMDSPAISETGETGETGESENAQ